MNDLAIDVAHAAAGYRGKRVLHGISLRIEPGEFVAVIGPNGSGKSTLLKLLLGLVPAVAGSVRVLGLDAKRKGRRVRLQTGYVAQRENVDPRLPITVRESVLTGLWGTLGPLRRPGELEWRRVAQALEQVGIAHLAERPLGHLSGGEYQRMAIARALVRAPSLYLLDEPTNSVDPDAQGGLVALVASIHARQSAAMVYVTHDLANIPAECRRVLLLEKGRISSEAAAADLARKRRAPGRLPGLKTAAS